ncbi:MAG: DUF2007 domain-containing protein [Gammaproteobacteria bacterium]|nr:DUF2007 domain-containing protein [Gammaproteobacteria bacterium]
MSLATVATFPNTMLAHIAKGLLESHGIAATVMHEHFHSTYSFAVGEVPLMVDSELVEQAQEILNQDFSHDLDDADDSTS